MYCYSIVARIVPNYKVTNTGSQPLFNFLKKLCKTRSFYLKSATIIHHYVRFSCIYYSLHSFHSSLLTLNGRLGMIIDRQEKNVEI